MRLFKPHPHGLNLLVICPFKRQTEQTENAVSGHILLNVPFSDSCRKQFIPFFLILSCLYFFCMFCVHRNFWVGLSGARPVVFDRVRRCRCV